MFAHLSDFSAFSLAFDILRSHEFTLNLYSLKGTLGLFLQWPCKIKINSILLSSLFYLFLGFFLSVLPDNLSVKILISFDEVIVLYPCDDGPD